MSRELEREDPSAGADDHDAWAVGHASSSPGALRPRSETIDARLGVDPPEPSLAVNQRHGMSTTLV